jgi:hypothetical protein
MKKIPWTRQRIEKLIARRIRGFTDEEIRNADPGAQFGIVFTPPLSAHEEEIARECWNSIVGSRLGQAGEDR